MEENTVQTLVAIEIVEPTGKRDRSVGAMYLVLTALILAVISFANFLFTRWQISRYLIQPPLYILIAIGCVWIYRRHFVSYRYTLTDQTFAVDRVAGHTDRALAAVLLTEIESISTWDRSIKMQAHLYRASVQPAEKSIFVVAHPEGMRTILLISPSEAFLSELHNQWQAAKVRKKQ